jgi:carboxyl-terminal processing protease
VENLKKFARSEKYFDDIESEIADLESKVAHNKDHDLREFDDQIRSILEERIVEHYYLMDGNFEASFDNDNQIMAAVDILNNNDEYSSLLASTVGR